MKIRAIRIEVNTSEGLFGTELEFGDGLNIIRGDNSSGKSTLFQSIMYGLGFEELLGGKNEKTMQSTLKDHVEFPKNQFHQIYQSFVYLEIENRDIITIKRSVISETRKPQLIDVFFGPLITGKNPALESKPMYIHDKGGATDDIYGFHMYLTEFLDWDLPEVLNAKGELHKLYLQQIAPTFVIEQKSGWSDFMATMPYYGMRNAESRVIEFLLKLDVFENEKRKQELSLHKQRLFGRWQTLYNQFKTLADRSGGTLNGLDELPVIINNFGSIHISVPHDDRYIPLHERNNLYKQELHTLEAIQTGTVGNNIEKHEGRLQELNQKLSQLSLNYELLSPELSFDKEKIKQYELQLIAIEDDIRKNKGALKVRTLGAKLETAIAKDICPTCHQDLKDSLLPPDIKQIPMGIEDNLLYLSSQQRMVEVFIEGLQRTIKDKEQRLEEYQSELSETRKLIREIKKELVQDERLPSIVEIEKRLKLKGRTEFLDKIIEDFAKLVEQLRSLSLEYAEYIDRENKLPKNFYSSLDNKKLSDLQQSFVQLLERFNYQSKPFHAIKISRETYFPVAQKLDGEELYYNIKFDSSASDFIRCIWAYTTSLLHIAAVHETYHPGILMLDEPKQQDISLENFRTFLTTLSGFKTKQVLVFASFENSDVSFEETTKGISFRMNKIEPKLIKPIETKEELSPITKEV